MLQANAVAPLDKTQALAAYRTAQLRRQERAAQRQVGRQAAVQLGTGRHAALQYRQGGHGGVQAAVDAGVVQVGAACRQVDAAFARHAAKTRVQL